MDELFEAAKKTADANKCCSYSRFTVGAALVTKQGKIYTGFNVENCGIQSICAERTAFIKALSEGEPAKNFKAIAVVGRRIDADKFSKTVPCGYCRQFMSEYADADLEINLLDDNLGEKYSYKLKDLLPEAFADF